MEHHSDSNSNRTLVACALCHERKLKCDDNIPCRSCIRNATECSRGGPTRENSVDMRLDNDDGNESDMLNENNQMLANEISKINEVSEINEMSTVLPSYDGQRLWFQDAWSLPYPSTALSATFPSDLNAGGLAHWAVDPNERGRVEGALSAAAPEVTSFLLPATNGPPVEGFSSASQHDVDQGDEPASSLTSQSPVCSRSSQEEHVTDLHSCLNDESLTIKRLIQVYFAEIHPYWPLLHAPTFDTANASRVLLGSMVMLASWLKGELDHMSFAPLVFDAVTATLLVQDCFPYALV